MKREAEAARIVVVNHHLFFADLALRGAARRARGACPTTTPSSSTRPTSSRTSPPTSSASRVSSRARRVACCATPSAAFVAAGLVRRAPRERAKGPTLAEVAREAAARFFGELALAGASEAASAAARGNASSGRVASRATLWTGERARRPTTSSTRRSKRSARYAEAHADGRGDRSSSSRRARAAPRRSRRASSTARRTRSPGPRCARARRVDRRVAGRPRRCCSASASSSSVGRRRPHQRDARRPAGGFSLPALAPRPRRATMSRSRSSWSPRRSTIASRALLYMPRDLPDPSRPGFGSTRGRSRIAELIEVDRRRRVRALHLDALDARAARRARRDRLRCRCSCRARRRRASLLDAFRAAKNAVLVATMSFWEGVDVPGDALRLVVIDKIPFAVPTDPVVAARSARDRGGRGEPVHRATACRARRSR